MLAITGATFTGVLFCEPTTISTDCVPAGNARRRAPLRDVLEADAFGTNTESTACPF